MQLRREATLLPERGDLPPPMGHRCVRMRLSLTAGPDPSPLLAAAEITALTIGPVQAQPVVVASDAKRQRLERTCRSSGVVRDGSVLLGLEALLQLIEATLQSFKSVLGDGTGFGWSSVWCCDPSTLTSAEQQKPKTEGCC